MRPIFAIFNFLRGLKTTKFHEVPAGTATKMYGEDSSGNLIKDDVPISNILSFHTQTNLTCDFASHNYIIATIEESLSVSVSNVTAGIVYGIMIKNDSESEITITLPTTNNVKSSATTTIAAGKYKELSFFSDGTTRYWQISEELS